MSSPSVSSNQWTRNDCEYDPAGAAAEIERLREVLTIPNITPETTSPAMFLRTLREHEKGQPVNGQDLINALMWRVRNQRREIARLQAKRGADETNVTPSAGPVGNTCSVDTATGSKLADGVALKASVPLDSGERAALKAFAESPRRVTWPGSPLNGPADSGKP